MLLYYAIGHDLLPHGIETAILTGFLDFFGPGMPLITTTDMSFVFMRLRFPVRVAFAITINKAQGQSLEVAGIGLSFSFCCSLKGQKKGESIHICTPWEKTTNAVNLWNDEILFRSFRL